MNFQFVYQSLRNFIPETILIGTFLVALCTDMIFKQKKITAITALLGIVAAGYFTILQTKLPPALAFTGTYVFHPPFGMYMVDSFAVFFKLLLALAGVVIVLFSMNSRELAEESKTHIGEYYALLVAMMVGMFLMTSVSDILMMYIALELVSISSYILAGFLKNVYRSGEAALKYVIFGAAASGLMLYGFSLLFGLTGTTNIFEIYDFLASHSVNHVTLLLSGILILAGFGYKISAVPFHFWTPDVYEGAPITITAFLSVASKAAGFAMLLRFLLIAYPQSLSNKEGFYWIAVLTGICVLTMSIGNLVALQQTNMKRLLAYSSIAQAGYILMGVVMHSVLGLTAVIIYFAMYLFMNLGAFYVVQVIAEKIGSEEIEDYKGLAKRMPFLSGMMVVFMMSLTGIPLTAGFIGKFYLFAAVLQNRDMYWLAVIAGLNSVIALYYYIKVIKAMYLDKGEEGERIPIGVTPVLLTLLMGIPTILFGVWFTPIVNFAQKTVMAFVSQ
ncbi:MAG TPA: NADH-quinone oxidoreductase subunit N [Candidatus Kapabacteria bacterium]|nr:NADH-quinone oxidoreductase subunit N [Candidatus Kapabacteria bacterium]